MHAVMSSSFSDGVLERMGGRLCGIVRDEAEEDDDEDDEEDEEEEEGELNAGSKGEEGWARGDKEARGEREEKALLTCSKCCRLASGSDSC